MRFCVAQAGASRRSSGMDGGIRRLAPTAQRDCPSASRIEEAFERIEPEDRA